MKTPEEYLEGNKGDILDAIGSSFYNTVSYQIHKQIVKEIIKQAQIDAIEETCKRCAEEARANIYNIPGPGTLQRVSIDKGSILKVADKMKEELK